MNHLCRSRWHELGFAALAVAQACALWLGSAGDTSQQLTAVCAASVLGCAALLWLARDARMERMPIGFVIGVAVATRLIAACATPLLEDDHFRYLWDGMRTATAFDPYHAPPSSFFGSDLPGRQWEAILSGINNPDISTIYGPVLQFLFGAAYFLAPAQLGGIQTILIVVDLAVIVALVAHRTPVRWIAAYAIHPLVLKEAIASAHPDALVGLLVLLSMMAWRTRRPMLLGALLGTAVATKVSALIVVPLLCFEFVKRRALGGRLSARSRSAPRTWALIVMGTLVAAAGAWYLPFALAGAGSDATALIVFAHEWQFNPLGFRVLSGFQPPETARFAAAGLVLITVGWTAYRWRSSASTERWPLPPGDSAFLVLLVFSPVVNPWYWLWGLAPAILRGRLVIPAVSALSAVSYLNSSVLSDAGWTTQTEKPFLVGWPLTLFQLTVLACALAVDHRRRRTSRQSHEDSCAAKE